MPGLIEGAAVAAAWEGDGDATPHEWSRAMLDAGITPRVASLNSLSFFAAGSSTAYTAAGSFCRWLNDTRGAARFRAVYASGDFSAGLRQSLSALERAWHAYLRTVPVDAAVVARARARFFRGSIFARRCPFDLEALERRALEDLAASSLVPAEQGFRALLRQDPSSLRARVALAVTLARRGDGAGADGAGRRDRAGRRTRRRAAGADGVGDALWRWDLAAARPTRCCVAADPMLMGDDEARTHALKRAALATGGCVRRGCSRRCWWARESLTPPPSRRSRARRGDPRAQQPPGGTSWGAIWFCRSAMKTRGLRSRRSGTHPRSRCKPQRRARLSAIASFHLGRTAEAAQGFRSIADDPSRPEGLRDDARDWLDRIRRMESAR